MLRVDVLAEGRLKFYDDRVDGYHVLVEEKFICLSDETKSTWGMVYLVLPEDGPHALDQSETLRLADALSTMLKAGAEIARLMTN